MFSWTPYPYARIVFFFCVGILWGIYLPDSVPIFLATGTFFILGLAYITISYLKSRESLKTVNPGFIGICFVVLAGFIQVYHATDYRSDDHFIHDKDPIEYYKVVVNEQVHEKENSWKVETKVLAVRENNRWAERSGKVLLYFSKKAFDAPYQYGNVLLLRGNPQLLSEPANPGEFDYKRFLTFKKIYHQHFLREGDVKLIDHQPPFSFIDYSIQARIWASKALNKYVRGAREQATASALVLGVTDGLDNDLLGAYAATGSLHVLSVSGLHVGIIYWLILLVLRPLNNSTSGKWTLAVISIGVLWSYAFVTGLSPSVLRAVTMFTFVAIARPQSIRTNIYNTLAVSAFCLLLYEPYMIMSVGFQLSYLAVIGIVYLQPIISRLWQPKQWLWDNVWQITCVSIAAQLATFALGLLYFHQFPVYFLFSNLFVIPISFFVLVAGIVLIAVSAISSVANLVGQLLEWSIQFLNYGVFKMEALPFSLIDQVYITTFQCWLLIFVVIFSVILFRQRKFSMAIGISICVILFSGLQWNHFYEEVDSRRITIYKVSGHSAMDIIEKGRAYFIADSVLINDHERLRFHIRPNRLRNGVDNIETSNSFTKEFKGCQLIAWKGVLILQIHDKEFSFPSGINLDYLVLRNNAIYNLEKISFVKFKTLILDSSNSFYFADRILKEANRASLNVHSVLHQGAFTVKL